MVNNLKNSLYKSLLYIIILAGSLKLFGWLLYKVWNSYIYDNYNVTPISQLEAVGIIAFIYLVFAGIKFGFFPFTAKESPGHMPQCQHCDKMAQPDYLKRVKRMSAEEKEQLREAIAKCCGFQKTPQAIKIELPQRQPVNSHTK